LGIWGAVALGALGAWIGARRAHVSLAMFADAAAPAIPVAQAFGRWGNWFNQELFGAPTTLPWGLRIDPAHRPPGYAQYLTFQPTFLYESLGALPSQPWLSGQTTGSASPTVALSRSTSPPTPSDADGSSTCASTPPTTSSAFV
jgi:Prolipoprotein diacylglyceryl transferase